MLRSTRGVIISGSVSHMTGRRCGNVRVLRAGQRLKSAGWRESGGITTVGVYGVATAAWVSVDRFPQDTTPICCLPFDDIGVRQSGIAGPSVYCTL